MKKPISHLAFVLAIVAYASSFASAQETSVNIWPPPMKNAMRGTATIETEKFLEVPDAVEKLRAQDGAASFTVAKVAPKVQIAYHGDLPDAALNGTGWSAWGDICVAADGRVYCGIGNHGKNDKLPQDGGGQAYIYRWNPATKELKKIVDVNALLHCWACTKVT